MRTNDFDVIPDLTVRNHTNIFNDILGRRSYVDRVVPHVRFSGNQRAVGHPASMVEKWTRVFMKDGEEVTLDIRRDGVFQADFSGSKLLGETIGDVLNILDAWFDFPQEPTC